MEKNATEIILEQLKEDVREIKQALLGDSNRKGLIVDVDRLKQARALHNTLLYLLFGTLLSTVAAVAIQTFTR